MAEDRVSEADILRDILQHQLDRFSFTGMRALLRRRLFWSSFMEPLSLVSSQECFIIKNRSGISCNSNNYFDPDDDGRKVQIRSLFRRLEAEEDRSLYSSAMTTALSLEASMGELTGEFSYCCRIVYNSQLSEHPPKTTSICIHLISDRSNKERCPLCSSLILLRFVITLEQQTTYSLRSLCRLAEIGCSHRRWPLHQRWPRSIINFR